jgi:hypothetical protein
MLKSTHTATVILPLNKKASYGKILPGMSGDEALLSVGKIADGGYELLFTSDECLVFKKGTLEYDNSMAEMTATRKTDDDLYEYEHYVKDKALTLKRYQHRISHGSNAETVAYWSAVFGNPTDSTFYNAIKNHKDISIPGLTATMIIKNLPQSTETDAGHMRVKPSNIDSTKKLQNKRFRVYAIDTKRFFDAYSDLCGRFPIQSFDGNEYILVFVHFTGYIAIRALKNRSATTQAAAYNDILQVFKDRSMLPQTYMMDNEISPQVRAVLKSFTIDECKIQNTYKTQLINLATPDNKRANRAERIMDIIKPHIISTIAGCDHDFPMKTWDKLLPQIEITVNLLLRSSHVDPQLSCYGAIFGAYDFMNHPMAPAGVKVMKYRHPDKRQTWEHKSTLAFITGPALEHYRCFRVVDFMTGAESITDTVSFHPKKVTMPGSSKHELLTAAIQQLTDVIKHYHDENDISHTQSTQLVQTLLDYKQLYITPSLSTEQQFPRVKTETTTKHINSQESDKLPDSAKLRENAKFRESDKIREDVKFQENDIAQEEIKDRTADNTPHIEKDTDSDTRVQVETVDEPKPASYKYSRNELQELNMQQIRDICTSIGIKPRRNSITSTLIGEILRIQGVSHQMRQPRRTRKPSVKDQALKSTEISNWELLSKLPAPTKPQPFVRGYWQEVKALRKVQNTSWGWNNKAYTATENEYTYRDHSKPKYNYHKEKKINPHIVIPAEHKELAYFMDEGCTTEHTGPIPSNAQITYYNPQLEYKIDQDGNLIAKVRGAAGGDKIIPTTSSVSRSTEPVLVKTFLNAAVSENAYIATIDLGKFFLHEMLPANECILLKLTESQVPQQTQQQYNFTWRLDKHNKKYILLRCHKAIYGLPQANQLAYEGLKENLKQYGYYETATKCLFRHEKKNISFIIHVDDFAIKVKKIKYIYELNRILEECGYKVKCNIPFINSDGTYKEKYNFIYTCSRNG